MLPRIACPAKEHPLRPDKIGIDGRITLRVAVDPLAAGAAVGKADGGNSPPSVLNPSTPISSRYCRRANQLRTVSGSVKSGIIDLANQCPAGIG